ncbi:hypothetical protein KAU15_02440 [candidate division WOR-3 bacterium]|nr:hypothetical protein [candidate division WOR-3 bacterium]
MKKFVILLIIILVLSSCGNKSGNLNQTIKMRECCTIIIDGPNTIEIGKTITLKAILYDKNNERIKNSQNITPNWIIDNNKVLLVKKVQGDWIKVKAIGKGKCEIKVMQDIAISTIIVTVE